MKARIRRKNDRVELIGVVGGNECHHFPVNFIIGSSIRQVHSREREREGGSARERERGGNLVVGD